MRHLPSKQNYTGSSPVEGTNITQDGAVAARLVHTQEVDGSIPSPATKLRLYRLTVQVITLSRWRYGFESR